MRLSHANKPTIERYAPVVAALYALVVLIALLRWAGLPRVDFFFFVLGAVSLIGTLAGLAFLGWYLLIKPLPADVMNASLLLKAHHRQGLAALLAISGVMIVVGGFWDEVWHRQYGVPFGRDLFWRPHLLMYAGLLSVMLAAVVSGLLLWRKGTGRWRQRFRAEPLLGWLVLLGAFLAYALPADPAWHMLYGTDITAWSLPHLVLMVTFSAIMVMAAAFQLSTLPARSWQSLLRLRLDDILVILALAFALMLGLQLLTTEWDGIRHVRRGSTHPFWQRPEWLLPVVVVALSTFFGTLANRATRYVGAATLVGLVALASRFLLVNGFGFAQMSTNAWLLALPPLAGIDLWYGYRSSAHPRTPSAFEGAFAATLGLALGTLPLLGRLYVYPQVSPTTLPAMLIMGFVTALWASWLGGRLGEALRPRRSKAPARARESRGAMRGPTTALVLLIVFMAWFVITATPPA
jgi:hypothetical protein